jgi:hypothetical protein
VEGDYKMKQNPEQPLFKRYREKRLFEAESEDRILVLARKLIAAKDEKGLNLFWDADEEKFMRSYIHFNEEAAC